MTTRQILDLARKHLGNGAAMDSSARSCVADAEYQLEGAADAERAGDFGAANRKRAVARGWAVRSLKYSVGIFHADYVAAAKVAS